MTNDRWISTACQGCLSNCALRVHVVDGAIQEICGNESAATNHGHVCPNTKLVADQLSDPDRLLHPMRRTNPVKGRHEDPQWERVSWDEALGEIADRMIELRKNGKSHELVIAKGRSTGISGLLTSVLPAIYGTPNSFNHDSICAEGKKTCFGFMSGHWEYPDYDLEHSRCLLLWGANPLASGRRKGHMLSAWNRIKRHAHTIVVDPHQSVTAKASDDWLCITPGTDAALALAIAHVILVEGLWNRDFVGDFKDGVNRFAKLEFVEETSFAEQKTRDLVTWWNKELVRRTPDWAEPICDIPASSITRIAREFARGGSKSVSWISTGVGMTPRGTYTSMCCYALNGLVGSFFAKGGVFLSPAFPSLALPSAADYMDEIARAGKAQIRIDHNQNMDMLALKKGKLGANVVLNALPESILNKDPYPISMLITYWTNPVFSCTGSTRWEKALAEVPFSVDITTNLSETSRFADIVLPAKHHAFETWGFVRSCENMSSTVALEQPCVSAPAEAANDEVGIPFMLAEKLAERGFDALQQYLVHELVDPCTGEPATTGDEAAEFAVKLMTRPLWAQDDYADTDAWERFGAQGAWNAPADDPEGPRHDFATESGRFEFLSGGLLTALRARATAQGMSESELVERFGWQARGELLQLPHYEEPLRLGDASAYPLLFSEHKSRFALEGRSANLPRFQELKALDPGDLAWDDALKINPTDMAALGLVDGDCVRVESVCGAITATAKSWDGTKLGTVVKCYGQGHWAYGHSAAADYEKSIPRGGNNNELIAPAWEHVTGSSARNGGFMRVRVKKIENR